jgi:hypothetical protein
MRNLILIATLLFAGCATEDATDGPTPNPIPVLEKWEIDLPLTSSPAEGCADWPQLQLLVYDPCTDPVLVNNDGPVREFVCKADPSCKAVVCERRITEDLSLWLTVSPTWAVADFSLCYYEFGSP